VDHWVYVADKNLEPFKEHHLYHPSKFTKAGYGMERPTISPLDRAALGIGQETFVICIVSRAIPEKGWAEAIRAVEDSRGQTGRDIDLVLVGNGPVWNSLSESVLPAYVHLLGFKPNPVDYYAMADLGLLATRYASECRPLTIIECLMAGRPVIATDVGEIRSMITASDGRVAGALIALQNGAVPIAALSAAISGLATDKTVYGNARALAPLLAEQFDMDQVLKQYADIYAKALPPFALDFAQVGGGAMRPARAGRTPAAEIPAA
jgi:glycosyltransferase involved in cell wall biosynthesis